MSVTHASPYVQPHRWLPSASAFWVAIMLALCLGILSLSAVAQIECRDITDHLLLEDGRSFLLTEDGRPIDVGPARRSCRFTIGNFRVPWSLGGRWQMAEQMRDRTGRELKTLSAGETGGASK
jgi:hypothetical protein